MTKYLILGGSGFIGYKLSSALSIDSHVIVGDIVNNFEAVENKNLSYRYIDFVHTDDFSPFLEGVDTVIHLVSTLLPCDGTENLANDIQDNVIQTIKLFEGMKKVGVKRIFFISSGGTVYGEGDEFPLKESSSKMPISKYGYVKLMTEELIRLFGLYNQIEFSIARLSNPYGFCRTFNRKQGLIPIIIEKILNGKELEVWGDGENIRDYIYIDDAIDCIVRILKEEKKGIFNVGTGIGTSINQIIEIIVSQLECNRPEIKYTPRRINDVKKNILDNSMVQEAVDWHPKTLLDDGIKLTIQHIRDYLSLG